MACAPLLALAVASAAPAQPSITATVDHQILTTDETVALTVRLSGVSGGMVTRPKLPDLPDFEIAGSSSASQYELTPAGASIVLTYQYALRPLRAGRLTIGPVTYSEGGKTYRTAPITVNVTKGAQPLPNPTPPPSPSAGPRSAADIRVTTDKSTVYVNEQVTWTAELWWTARAEVSDYAPPSFDGFWTEQIPTPRPSRHIVNGREYAMQQIAVALFPLAPGAITIPPASIHVSQSPFGVGRKISSDPVVVHVRPLPEEGRPPNFGGAVGNWAVRLETDRQELSTGEALAVVAIVTGTGNVQAVSPPTLRAPASFELRQASGDKRSHVTGSTVEGEARFEWVAIPSQPGRFDIGPVELPFFDTKTERYETAAAGPVQITVTGEPIAAPSLGETTRARLRDVQNALSELPREPRIEPAHGPLYRSPFFLAAQLIPLLAVIGGAAYGSWRRRLLADPTYARQVRARRAVRERLALAREHLANGDRAEFYAQLHRAVLDYLSAELAVPASRLSADTVAAELRDSALGDACARQAADVLAACERVRFSASLDEADCAGDIERAQELIDCLTRGRPAARG